MFTGEFGPAPGFEYISSPSSEDNPSVDKSKRKNDSCLNSSKSLKQSIDSGDEKYDSNKSSSVSSSSDTSSIDSDSFTRDVLTQVSDVVEHYSSLFLSQMPHDHTIRNQNACAEERNGLIQVHIVSNVTPKVLSDEILIWLVEFRNLISTQLSHISQLYITRLVFDPKHKNLVLVEKDKVIGGICFRMFPAQNFTEIIFLVVAANKQIKGYGTHIMNHLKDYHVKHKIFNFLTYAAHEAYGYFEMQAFTPEITLPEHVYSDYIKTFRDATLMQCELDPRISYSEIPALLSWQKMVLTKLIEELQSSSQESLDESSPCSSESRSRKTRRIRKRKEEVESSESDISSSEESVITD